MLAEDNVAELLLGTENIKRRFSEDLAEEGSSDALTAVGNGSEAEVVGERRVGLVYGRH